MVRVRVGPRVKIKGRGPSSFGGFKEITDPVPTAAVERAHPGTPHVNVNTQASKEVAEVNKAADVEVAKIAAKSRRDAAMWTAVGVGTTSLVTAGGYAGAVIYGDHKVNQAIEGIQNIGSSIGSSLANAIKALGSKFDDHTPDFDNLGNRVKSGYDGAKREASELLEQAEAAVHGLPSSIGAGQLSKSFGDLTGQVTTVLILGMTVFGIYEISNVVFYSRRITRR